MKNNDYNTSEMEKAAELEHIEYLITSGINIEEIIKVFPNYKREEIGKIVYKVARFCWFSDDEGRL